MADYPNNYYSPRAKENWPGVVFDPEKKTIIFKEDFDSLEREILAIEKELALNPKGPYTSVKARLEAIETLLDSHKTRHEDGGPDEINVTGLSGELADPQPPKAHTHTPVEVGLGNVTNDAQLKRAAGDFDSFPEKTSPVSDDILLIEDSGNALAKKKLKISNLPAPPAEVDVKQVEVDFGTTPIAEKEFTIPDAAAKPTSQILAQIAYEAPTDKELDELEMNDFVMKCQPGSGQFKILIRSVDGSYLHDKFKINYLIG